MMNSSEQPPAKYQDDPEPPRIPVRSEPWYEDGNIVLEAESMQFRVFRGVLSASSNIFRDMFSMPQPSKIEDLVEGCPVVQLADSAEDWKYVLKALYERSYASVRLDPVSLNVIVAFLRLGRKYEIESLYLEATTRLSFEFPPTLKEWDETRHKLQLIKWHPGLTFDIINLAHEHGLPHILPAAFYDACLSLDFFRETFRGVRRKDGTLAILSSEDQKICIQGWAMLIHEQTASTFGWLRTEGDVFCSTSAGCLEAKTTLYFAKFSGVPEMVALNDWDKDYEEDLCERCAMGAKTSQRVGRSKVWNLLPSFFGLPGWEELLKSD